MASWLGLLPPQAAPPAEAWHAGIEALAYGWPPDNIELVVEPASFVLFPVDLRAHPPPPNTWEGVWVPTDSSTHRSHSQ